MTDVFLKKILNHPDKDEIVSKLAMNILPKTVFAWLDAKYVNPGEKKFVVTEKNLELFKKKYLNVYNVIHDDIIKTKENLKDQTEKNLLLSIQNNKSYKELVIKSAESELDIRQTVKNLCTAIEARFGQVFDEIQRNPSVNIKVDQVLVNYSETLGSMLEKYYRFVEAPAAQTTNIQNNITLNVVDQQISVVVDTVKDILSKMDINLSLQFMDEYNERLSKLKTPQEKEVTPVEARLIEARSLNDKVSEKLFDAPKTKIPE